MTGNDIARGPVRDCLNALDLAWGNAYDIGMSDGMYYAKRADGTGDALTGETAEELNSAIRADWERKGKPGA